MNRYDVLLVALDPVLGSEIAKTRPAVVVSPDEMNRHLRTLVVAPLTSTRKAWPSRIEVRFGGQDGQIALDQLRTIDKARVVRRLGTIEAPERAALHDALAEMFAP